MAALDKKNFLFIDVDDDGPNFLPLFSLRGRALLLRLKAKDNEKKTMGEVGV